MRQIILLLVAALFCGWVLVDQVHEPEPPERYSLHLVRSGDTLWDISEQYMPEVDPRLGVKWISRANGLRGAIIHPGDVLSVPDSDGPLMEPLGPRYSSPEAAKAAEREFQRLLREKTAQPGTRGTTSRTTSRTMTVEATAYCTCKICTGKAPDHPAYGITASGRKVRPGAVAVDPSVIPLGTKMWIEGYGEAEALDTGGAIKGKTIDVYFPSHQQALEWGRKRVAIKILQEVDSPK